MVVFVRYFQKEDKKENYFRIVEVHTEVEDLETLDGDPYEMLKVTLTRDTGSKIVCHNVSDLEIL